ncbi:MAG: FAD-dependent oxidoreductase [Burkholderiaceae bacterium]|nr:FAD-dependent oxidoreductase [Burkholderiaceae bacterium]
MNARNLPPTAWTTGSTEVFKTGTWRARLPRHVSAPSPCHAACPVNGDISHWIGRARERDFRGAWEILTRNNPFPAVSGRVCHHPCEAACNRQGYDEPISICKLERHVGDLGLAQQWSYPAPAVERSERVAIVGGGPSGLSAAYHLRRRGYAVTIFEAQERLGGLMRDGIPAYRLPRDVLDGEIDRIVALGIDVRCGVAIDSANSFAQLREQFDAVYVAAGARRPKRLPQLDYAQPWVVDGAGWLAQANAGQAPELGERIVVIGGGSAAIDVARSARRAGHEVTMLALEARAQMPAQRAEVEEALEEGVQLVDGASLVRAVADARSGSIAIECVRVNFVPGAERGRFRVEPIGGSEFRLNADAIVPSIGQDPDLAPFAQSASADGALLRVDATQATDAPGVYAGGDVASMARFVTEAFGMGRRAAIAIDRALCGKAQRPFDGGDDDPPARSGQGDGRAASVAGAIPALAGRRLPGLGAEVQRLVPLDSIATFYYAHAARAPELRVPADERDGDVEVQLGLDGERALAEAARCFSCGTCISCDNCFHYCPDLAIRRLPDGGYEVDGDYCKGCGICVRECPTGSMEMIEEMK